MKELKHRIVGGLAAGALLATGLAFATAVGPVAAQVEVDGVCYDESVVPTFGDVIEKEVRGFFEEWAFPGWIPLLDGGNVVEFDWMDHPDFGPLNDDGRARSGSHKGTFDRDGVIRKRGTEYRYLVVGQFENGVEIIQVEVPCPGDTSTTTTEPVDGSTTTTEPVDGSTTTTEPVDGSTTTTEPVDGSTTTTEPVDGSTTTTEPVDGSTTTTEPVDGSTTTTEPVDGSTTTTEPVDGSTTTTEPVDGSTSTTTTFPVGGDGGTAEETTSTTATSTTVTSTTVPSTTVPSTTTTFPVGGDGGSVPESTPSGTLPQTGGAGSSDALQFGALLLVAGAGLLAAVRRRGSVPTT